ncbi:MAG: transposase [Actinobacteria bacterium]|nr:transposase [Actinomycetota bacterium]
MGVIGVDTHRDFHQVEIAYPSGAMIATRSFSNDSVGYAQTLTWVFEHAPGPRLVLSIEGTRSYGAGLTRAAATAGLPVIEAEQPRRTHRRGRGKSDSIDAHLAVLYAWVSTPPGDREALRILLCARGGADHHQHRTDQPAARAAARRRRHRPAPGPRAIDRHGLGQRGSPPPACPRQPRPSRAPRRGPPPGRGAALRRPRA